MQRLSFSDARTLPCAGCFSFVTQSGSQMTAIVPAFQGFDERVFFPAMLCEVRNSFTPALTVAVYL